MVTKFMWKLSKPSEVVGGVCKVTSIGASEAYSLLHPHVCSVRSLYNSRTFVTYEEEYCSSTQRYRL